jgi:uncharacterized membrane protein YfcA
VQLSALAIPTGIGGGSLWNPIISSAFSMPPVPTAAITDACVFVGTCGALVAVIFAAHPADPRHPLIDYELATFLMPTFVMGNSIGIGLNAIIPDIAIYCLVFVTLVFVSVSTLLKALAVYRADVASRLESAEDMSESSEPGKLGGFPRPPPPVALKVPWGYAGWCAGTAAVFAGLQSGKAVLRSDTCGWQTILLQVLEVAYALASTWAFIRFHARRASRRRAKVPLLVRTMTMQRASFKLQAIDVHVVYRVWRCWSALKLWSFSLAIFLVGLWVGSLGMGGGGSLLSPLLLLLDLQPQSGAATSNLVVLATSGLGTLTYALLEEVPWLYVAAFAPTALVGGVVGGLGMRWVIQRTGLTAISPLVMAGIIFAVCLLEVAFPIRREAVYLANGGSISSGQWCSPIPGT